MEVEKISKKKTFFLILITILIVLAIFLPVIIIQSSPFNNNYTRLESSLARREFKTLDMFYSNLREFAWNYSSLVTLNNIGSIRSMSGDEIPIYEVIVSTGAPKKQILIVSGLNSNDYRSPENQNKIQNGEEETVVLKHFIKFNLDSVRVMFLLRTPHKSDGRSYLAYNWTPVTDEWIFLEYVSILAKLSVNRPFEVARYSDRGEAGNLNSWLNENTDFRHIIDIQTDFRRRSGDDVGN